MNEPSKNHGGSRRNAGRKTERHDLVVKKHSVSYDDKTHAMLRVLGQGEVSRGIRLATRTAYDLYQANKLELPKIGA